jgi:class 3 adenylate cyclase
MYMDIHEEPHASADAVAAAHLADLRIQAKYGVEYHKYWLNEAQGKIFCLCSAPNAEAAMNVHREAHGLVAQKIIEIAPEVAESFLGGCEVDPAGAAIIPGADGRDTGIRTVLFTDIVDSTGLMERLGDDACMALIEVHDAAVRGALQATGGREIKHTGDGIMAAFVSAAAAVRCATRIQKALAEHPVRNGDAPVFVRIGAAAGEPVEANDDLFGSTVHLAARLCSHAESEQSLVSNVVTELCLGKGLTFCDLGEVVLKGFDQPVRVHAVQ